MRIISGTAKGTRLVGLRGAGIRPTLDRVKESFFNTIGPYLDGQTVLDWFAGTGTIGIEALSRGAQEVVFVEKDPKAQRILLKNLDKCGFGPGPGSSGGERWRLLKKEAFQALAFLEKTGLRADLVYVDPPFDARLYTPCLDKLSRSPLLGEGARVVVEHYHKQGLQEKYGTLIQISKRRLGDSCLTYFRKVSPAGGATES